MIAVLALMLVIQQTPAPVALQAPSVGAPAAPAAPAPPRRPLPTTSTLQVRVTDRTGVPVRDVTVNADGLVSREGVTDANGEVQFRAVANGTYRVRAAGPRFITLEKEVAVRAGSASVPIEFALSGAPPPPPPPPPSPAPAPQPPVPAQPSAAPAPKAGEARVVSIVDLAERSLTGRDPMKLVPIACSGLDNTQLIVLRETRIAPANPDADEMLYVVGGEATLLLGGREQAITSGWFAVVPRGVSHTLTRRGRNPLIVLSTTGGRPCGDK